MRIGRIYKDFSAEGFDHVKQSGLSFIEVCCNNEEAATSFISIKENVLAEIKRTGIDVSCIGRWNHDVQVNGSIDKDRKQSYIDLLDTAIYLGAKTFVCGCNYDESVSLYRNYTNAIDFLGELVERAGDKIKVSVQNCSWNNFIITPREWEVVLGELKGLWIKYDASHALGRGQDYLAHLSDWCDRVAHVHIKGKTIAGATPVADPPAGMDDIAWPSLFAILYSHSYDGDLSIEPHSKIWRGELGDAGVEFTKNYISQFILK